MINKTRIRWKLLEMLLLAALVTFVTAFFVDLVLQARSAALAHQNETTTRWLTGQIIRAQDEKLYPILTKMLTELQRSTTHFESPGANMPEAPMFDPAKQVMSLDEAFELPAKDVSKRVRIAYGGFTYYQFNPPEMFVDQHGLKPGSADYERDQKCYKTFMAPFYDTVKDAGITKGKDDVNSAVRKYSDALFKYFGIDKDSTNDSPRLTVGNIFASSSNGTLAIFPRNSLNLALMPDFKLKERAWYLSAYAKSEDKSRTELFPGTDASGLSPFYLDEVTGDYTRTLWHRFTVSDSGGRTITYVLCIDLALSSSPPPAIPGSVFPTWMAKRSGLLEGIVVGGSSSIVVLLLGFLFTFLVSAIRPQILSYFLVRRRPKAWVTEQSYTPIYQAFAPQRGITFLNVTKHEDGIESNVKFSAWFQMNVAKLGFEKNQLRKDLNQSETREEVTLNTIDKDPAIRGYEVWRVFRSRWRSEGSCRLCDQDVRYRDQDEPIAEPTIRHRRSQKPAIDTRLAENSSIKDTRSLEEAITWQATDIETKTLGKGYTLTPAPELRIPQVIQGLSLFKDSLKTFEMLSQSRIEVDDCVELSVELFRDRNVRAVCHIDYFRKIASSGELSFAGLQEGKNIERILVANKPEDMVNFLNTHHEAVESLLNARNQELFRLYLDDTGVDFNTFGNQRFDLDFAIVYKEDEPPLVLASNLSEINISTSVKGYLSWRKVDVLFFQTLYESFIDKRVTLRLDELPSSPSTTDAPMPRKPDSL